MRTIALTLVALALSACGAPAPLLPASDAPVEARYDAGKAPMAFAAGIAMTYLRQRHAKVVLSEAIAYPVTERGTLEPHSVYRFRFWAASPTPGEYQKVEVLVESGKPRLGETAGTTDSPPKGIWLPELMGPGDAIKKARKAGLQEGENYRVRFAATGKAEAIDVASHRRGFVISSIRLNARTGAVVLP